MVLGGCAAAPRPSDPDASPAEVSRRSEGSLVIEGIPPIPGTLRARLQGYQATRSAILQDWLADGSLLVTTRFGETRQLHRVAEPGAARAQLTFFEEPVSAAVASPTRERLLFLRDEGGSEAYQIYQLDLADGATRRMTDGESRNGAPVFAPDGERFAYFSTKRNGTDWDVYLRDLEAQAPRRVLRGEGSWYPEAFSPTGDRLIAVRYVSIAESHPWVVDLETGDRRRLFPQAGPAAYHALRFGPDGQSVYFTSDRGGEFVRLYRKDLANGEVTALTGDVAWNVERFEISTDGRYLAWTVNEEGYSRLYLRDLDTGRFVALPGLPDGVIYGFEFGPRSGRLALTLSRPTSSADVYTIDLTKRTLARWTRSELGGLDRAGFVAPDLVRYPTFDAVDGSDPDASGAERRTIPAFVYRPETPGPHPVVIDIHGGPESQARPWFSPDTQFLVKELDVAVVVPNVRGSSGYGRSYHQLDDRRRREDAVRDIGALLEWIGRRPDLDERRVAVTGGSYGGYMVLASLARYPERLRAGVDVVGISSFVTFLESTRDYRRDLRREEYGDERDPEMRAFLESISPVNHADRIRDPLLVAQGANDPRVPASESEQMVAEIRRSGGTVWYLLARDEGHGFRKKRNRDFYQAAKALFLERLLLDGSGESNP